MLPEWLEEFKVKNIVSLKGFTSTSLSKEAALGFTDNSLEPEKIPVLMVIDFKGRRQYFNLSSEKYSAYPSEQEVLLQDGIQYRVLKNEVVDVQTFDDDVINIRTKRPFVDCGS